MLLLRRLKSKLILSEEGLKLGLIDAIVPPQDLLKVSRQWALDIAEARKPWVCSLHRTDKIGFLSEACEIIKNARQLVKRTAPNMPQHQACLDVIEEGIVHGGYAGVLKFETAAAEVSANLKSRVTGETGELEEP